MVHAWGTSSMTSGHSCMGEIAAYYFNFSHSVMPVKYAYKEYQKQEFISFGFPLMIEVPKAECTFANLYSMIESQCR